MKSGTIVYVLSQGSNVDTSLLEAEVHRLPLAGKLCLAIDIEDVVDRWFELTVQGMKNITCLQAEKGDQGLRLTGRELRLCG